MLSIAFSTYLLCFSTNMLCILLISLEYFKARSCLPKNFSEVSFFKFFSELLTCHLRILEIFQIYNNLDILI